MTGLEDRTQNYEHIRTWEENGFQLELYDTHHVDNYHKNVLAYRFLDLTHGEDPIFEGDDFACSPLYSIDSDKTISSLLGFLSLKPGDTDREYFDNYTTRQEEWMEDRAEELGVHAYELGCRIDNP